jgi:hypothetical protein
MDAPSFVSAIAVRGVSDQGETRLDQSAGLIPSNPELDSSNQIKPDQTKRVYSPSNRSY